MIFRTDKKFRIEFSNVFLDPFSGHSRSLKFKIGFLLGTLCELVSVLVSVRVSVLYFSNSKAIEGHVHQYRTGLQGQYIRTKLPRRASKPRLRAQYQTSLKIETRNFRGRPSVVQFFGADLRSSNF